MDLEIFNNYQHHILHGCLRIFRRLLGGYRMGKLVFLGIGTELFLLAKGLWIYHFGDAGNSRFLVFLRRFGSGWKGFGTFDGRREIGF